jgi:hypothetical protein
MATLEDLEASRKAPKEAPKEAEPVEEFDDDYNQDMLDALSLLNKCMHLLDYISDRDLCKTVTNREREVMGRVSESIRIYLDAVEGSYEEEVDE